MRGRDHPIHENERSVGSTHVLAFFDVLGFSDRLAELGLDTILAVYRELATMLDQLKEPGAFAFWVPTDFDGDVEAQIERASRNESTRWAPAASSWAPGVAYFSDTILLWMPYHPVACGAFIDLSINFFCRALSLRLPLRGALAIGELYMDTSRGIFLGAPIVEGAQAESAQRWCGFSLGPSFKEYPCIVPGDRFLDHADHVKPGRTEHVLSVGVDWTWHWRAEYPEFPLDAVAAWFPLAGTHPYWATTLSFAESSAARRPTGLNIYA